MAEEVLRDIGKNQVTMTTEERTILQDLLTSFDKKEDECYDKMQFLSEHNFNMEKQFVEARRQTYHACLRELRKAINDIDNLQKED